MVEFFEGDIYRDLRQKGYTEQEIAYAMQQPQQQPSNYSGMSSYYQPANSMFSPAHTENLVQYQLELDNILERMEHILRGDKLTFKDGREMWIKCIDPKQRLFNDEGVAELMRILSNHVNRNTILSDYSEERIMFVMEQLGTRLNNLIFMKYDKFGLDNSEKRKIYTQILFDMCDMVESTYRRAKDGGERLSLREARMVNQTEVLANPETMMGMQKPKSIFNPFTWGRK